jgi:hypothetical protein
MGFPTLPTVIISVGSILQDLVETGKLPFKVDWFSVPGSAFRVENTKPSPVNEFCLDRAYNPSAPKG